MFGGALRSLMQAGGRAVERLAPEALAGRAMEEAAPRLARPAMEAIAPAVKQYMPRGEAGAVSAVVRPGFFSKLEDVVNFKMGGSMETGELKKMLWNHGVTPAEMDSTLTGLKGKVSKVDVLNEIKENGTRFEDVVLGETDPALKKAAYAAEQSGDVAEADRIWRKGFHGDPKFETYQEPDSVPGSYRELFVTAPVKEAPKNNLLQEGQHEWKDGHSAYADIDNPIIRIRYNDREVNGKKILFVEEMQGPSATEQAKMPEALQKRIYDIGTKRVLALAKEKGYDGVAWTTGEMQASRYDLSKHVRSIDWEQKGIGTPVKLHLTLKDGTINTQIVPYEKVSDYIGKDAAKKVIDDIEGGNVTGSLTGLDLKVGGEGLKSVYNKTLPEKFKKYGKEEVKHEIINNVQVSYVPITYKTPIAYPFYVGAPLGVLSAAHDREQGKR